MHRHGDARRSLPSKRDDLILPEIAIDFRAMLLPSRQTTTDWLLILNEPNIEPMMRLRVPASPALEKHLWPMIMSQLEFREPHTFAERKKHSPFDRASLPTDAPILPIPLLRSFLWRP
jgi:hypothetical protein